jgi:hypothetical protein
MEGEGGQDADRQPKGTLAIHSTSYDADACDSTAPRLIWLFPTESSPF